MKRYSPWILEAWATWETLRKLGFSANDIFWEFANTANAIPVPGLALNVVLRTQDRTLTVTCSKRLSSEEGKKLEADARVFHEEIRARAFEEAEMNEVLHASYVWRNKEQFLMSLSRKGFSFPYRLS